MEYPIKADSLSRMMRGEQIAKEKVISENSDGSFSVPSQSVEEIVYHVKLIENVWTCNCPDCVNRKVDCKHIHAVRFWLASHVYLAEKPKPKVFSDDSVQCDKCGSIRVVRFGHSDGKQIFKCKDCGRKFRQNLIKKTKYSAETISLTLDLYFSGMSLNKIARTLNDHYDFNLGKASIYRWIQKFIPKISEYVNMLTPELSDTWHADELFVKMKNGISYKGNKGMAFLWNVMDRKTRFLLASKLSSFRDKNGAFQAFKEARANSKGQFPETIFTDSAQAYENIGSANVRGWNPRLIRKAGINKPQANNNRIERFNGTLRERVKVQRGWKSMETPIAEGERIQYNFVKPHQALAGQTPAQRAGIDIRQKDKWLGLLESATKS